MTAKVVMGIALGSIVAIAVAPVSWTVPILAAGAGIMLMVSHPTGRS